MLGGDQPDVDTDHHRGDAATGLGHADRAPGGRVLDTSRGCRSGTGSHVDADPPARPSRPAVGPLQSTERLVIVDDLGIAFGAPTLFMEYDPKALLDGAADSPMMKELAGRMRMSPDQLRTGVLNQVDRILVGGPVAGGPSSIVTARVPLATLPPIPALRVQLKAVLGREIDTARAVRTPAGPGTLVTYTLVAGGGRFTAACST